MEEEHMGENFFSLFK